jgi:hypothetical protein
MPNRDRQGAVSSDNSQLPNEPETPSGPDPAARRGGMIVNSMHTVKAVLIGFFIIGALYAQQGRDEGTLKGEKGTVPLALDIDKDEKLGWIGSVDIAPPDGPKGLLAEKVAVNGDEVTWQLTALGNAAFKAKHNAEQKTLNGTAAVPGGEAIFELKRTGDPKVNLPAPSTAITKDLVGQWEGTLEVKDQTLRLIAAFTSGPSGTGLGELVSVDQGGGKIPMSTVIQEGANVKFEIAKIGGSYAGTMNEAKTEIKGDWMQGGLTAPLVLKKAAEAK